MKTILGDRWDLAQPGSAVGLLVMTAVSNPDMHPALEARKQELVRELHQRYKGFDRSALRELPVLSAYHRFFKQFKKTYHLQLQLESVLAGKPIPSVAALVEAMFIAELEDQLLTAGHDLNEIIEPVLIDVSDGTQKYTRMNGQDQILKAGDLFVADREGVLSSVVYGPDRRTRIHSGTHAVLFTTYAVPGIPGTYVQTHLQRLSNYVHMISPQAEVQHLEIVGS